MNVTSIGSNYSYLYNTGTRKLETTQNGVEDDFVKWFNGEIPDDELPDSLNGLDYNKRRDIRNLFQFFTAGIAGGKVYSDLNGEKVYEVSGDIVDAMTSTYSVGGKEILTAYNTAPYTRAEIDIFSTIKQPYGTRISKSYDPENNSINIAVGDTFSLGNGYSFTVLEDSIYAKGYGMGSFEDDKRANHLVGGLNSLIHFADQQWFSSMIHEEDTPMVLELLNQLGVDTSREFTINGTKCEVRNGRIREVGNTSVVPSRIYNEAVKRYEEHLYIPLNELFAKK